MKILSQMHPWTKKFLLNFGSNVDPESVSGYGSDPDHVLLADVRSLTALVERKMKLYQKWIKIGEQ